MITPTNNLAKLGIGAAHRMRLELADQLFYPVLVDARNPSQPMPGGFIGNRSGSPTRLTEPGIAGNTGAYGADYSPLEGDPITAVKTMTSDGPIFTMQRYDGKGIITIEDPRLNTSLPVGAAQDYSTIPRYVVKADGIVYDILTLKGNDPAPDQTAANGPYQHWAFAAEGQPNPAGGTFGTGTYTGASNTYQPHADFAPGNINEDMYVRPVGLISFRDKQGASSGAIQEQLQRAQSTLDTMSRLLKSLHQESQTAFSNFVIR